MTERLHFLLSANEKPGTGLRAGTQDGETLFHLQKCSLSPGEMGDDAGAQYMPAGIKTLHRRP